MVLAQKFSNHVRTQKEAYLIIIMGESDDDDGHSIQAAGGGEAMKR